MLYLTGVANPMVREWARTHGNLALLNTPNTNYALHDWPLWAADNGAFNAKTYKGDDAWFAWLESKAPLAGTCLFATAPDVVGDAQATLDKAEVWLPQIRQLGFKAALVAQDGLEKLTVPWDSFDVLFIGGSTEWKLGPDVHVLVAQARARGKQVHMGRVNSFRRLRHAAIVGCNTVDGTFLAFGPATNLPRMQVWLDRLRNEPLLPWATA